MADVHNKATRSHNMSRITGKTKSVQYCKINAILYLKRYCK